MSGLDGVPALIQEAWREQVQSGSPVTVFPKGSQDLVTNWDVALEDRICEGMAVRFPRDGFCGEETHPETSQSGRVWVLDPIDGTANFVAKIPLYATQIALLEQAVPVYSAAYFPVSNAVYTAKAGNGAWCNGAPIRVSAGGGYIPPLVSLGDFSRRAEELRKRQAEVIQLIYPHVKIRMMSCGCADFCCLAAGKTQALITFGRNVWDILPGFLLVHEAGAHCNWDGRGALPSPLICAATPELLEMLQRLVDAVYVT